jgi:hypothetical protein
MFIESSIRDHHRAAGSGLMAEASIFFAIDAPAAR